MVHSCAASAGLTGVYNVGTVVKIGPGRQAGNGQYMQAQVEPGDKVRFRQYAGTNVKLEGKEYKVLRAYDILAKFK
jgi:chaperonin GroES